MVGTSVEVAAFVELLCMALFVLQAGVWTYQALGLAVGAVGVGVGIVLVLYAWRRTFRLIGGVTDG